MTGRKLLLMTLITSLRVDEFGQESDCRVGHAVLIEPGLRSGQLTRNVIEFAKDKPPLHTGNVQSAVIQYLIAACGAPPLPK